MLDTAELCFVDADCSHFIDLSTPLDVTPAAAPSVELNVNLISPFAFIDDTTSLIHLSLIHI